MAAQFGLDIGSSAIKVVQLSGGKGKYRVEAMGLGVNPGGEPAQIAEAVRRVVMEAGIKTRQVKAALAEAQVYTRVIQVPPLSEAELASSLSWEAEQYVPIPLTEVNLDWQIMRRGEGQKMEVLLVAAPKRSVEWLVGVLQSAGLEPVGLETEILAAARALVPGEQVPPTLVCNLGATAANLAIVENGQVVFTYLAQSGGMALTRVISQSLGLELAQAEQYKRTYGIDETQLEGKISKAMMPILTALVMELRKAMNFYATRNQQVPLSRLVLAGGGAQLPGLSGFLAAQLGMEVVIGTPLAGFEFKEGLKQRWEGLESVFAVAVGLAMGGGV